MLAVRKLLIRVTGWLIPIIFLNRAWADSWLILLVAEYYLVNDFQQHFPQEYYLNMLIQKKTIINNH